MLCVFCGKEIDDKVEICPFCNNRVGYKNSTDTGSKTSGTNTGSVNSGTPVISKKKVNWTLCLIMSIFFGSFGVDRFMMGHVGLGILKIFTCYCGIWWIIDVILIATKYKFQDIEWVES
jgi:hypothetical protein